MPAQNGIPMKPARIFIRAGFIRSGFHFVTVKLFSPRNVLQFSRRR
jgi:hypothetical protein